MKKVTVLIFSTLLLVSLAQAQQNEFRLNVPTSDDVTVGYTTGLQSGARGVSGPYDLDGDGNMEVLATDYTGGGRVHVIENVSADTWELVYSTPWNDSTGSAQNGRFAVGADMDLDGFGEIIFLAGRGYSETNPNFASLPPGLYVYENTGADNDFGTAPASIYEFGDDLPDRWVSEQMAVGDVDGDGFEEIMFPNNGGTGGNRYDNWYVISVSGDIGSGFEVWTEEVRISARASEDFDPVNRGGGSSYSIHPADLDGDGTFELSMQSFNNFNFTNGDVTGADTYVFPEEGAANGYLQAAPNDDVALFGGVVVDIDGNGDDEVFYPRLGSGDVSILNYESGEDVLQVTTDNLVLDMLSGLSSLGITAADLDGDGSWELIGTGPGYNQSRVNAGQAAAWINIVEFNGGDPEDAGNYTIAQSIEFPEDSYIPIAMLNNLDGTTEYVDNDLLIANRDSVIFDNNNAPLGYKFTYLGDADLDGLNEVAFGIQGVRDSLYVLTQNADSSYAITGVTVNENRFFLRVMSGGGTAVSITDERVIVPDDYKLHANYPNPFNPTTTIGFTLPLNKAVSVKVYDMTGRLVKTLVNNQTYEAGFHEVIWDSTNDAGITVASGSYIYTLEYGNFRQANTMVLIK